MRSYNALKNKQIIQERLNKGEDHYYAFFLTNICDDSGFISRRGWVSLLNYHLYYKDALGEEITQTMDFSEMSSTDNRLNNIALFVKENTDNGVIVIIKDDDVLNHNDGEVPFDLFLSVVFTRTVNGEKQAFNLMMTCSKDYFGDVILSITDKKKMLILHDGLLKLAFRGEENFN